MFNKNFFINYFFERKYPLFKAYFTDINERNNMLNNADLYRKYKAYDNTISFYLLELKANFSDLEIKKFIKETIIKLPDEVMTSFITAYLNSDTIVKSNSEVFNFYLKTQELGENAVHFVESHGIIASDDYLQISEYVRYEKINQDEEERQHELDLVEMEFNQFYKEDLSFKEDDIRSVFNQVSLAYKKVINELIKNNLINILDEVFADTKYNFYQVLLIINNYHFENNIINLNVLHNISASSLYYLLMEIIDADSDRVKRNVIKLISKHRYELLLILINTNRIKDLDCFADDQINLHPDYQVLDIIHNNNDKKRVVKDIKDNIA